MEIKAHLRWYPALIFHPNQDMYVHTWKKYLPVIRLLLKKSGQADQSMTLNRTDFERNNKLRKPVCSFDIEIVNGRLQRLNAAVQVKGLMTVLTEDQVAMGLLRNNHFAINLSSDFLLSIRNTTPVAELQEVKE